MVSPSFIGIDLGTSSVKTLLVDAQGRTQAHAARPYPIQTPRPGWAEQDPQTWTDAALACLAEVVGSSGFSPASVGGIGLSGQMHGTVCLDATGAPLRPAIIWADRRSTTQVKRILTEIGPERLGAWTGNPVATGFTLPTWLWLREHEPETLQRTACMLLPKDYLRFRLTGEIGSEPSDAAASLLFDPAAGKWSAPLLDALDLDPSILPDIGASHAVAGGLTPEVAQRCGLPAGTPVVYGGGDQACQALGRGVIAPGVVSSTIGTGGQILAPLLAPQRDPHLRLHIFSHALPGRWYLMAATLNAGLSLRWLSERIFPGETVKSLADLACSAPSGASGLFFLPHLVGERSPYLDPQSRALFAGLSLEHGKEHIARAVMEGVVYALRQGLDLIRQAGLPVERMVASGGAAAHPLWLQLQADMYNHPIEVLPEIEAAALGAAMLAALGVSQSDPGPEEIHSLVTRFVQPPQATVRPNPETVEVYTRNFETFTRLYPALSSLYPDWPASGTGAGSEGITKEIHV